MGPRAPRGMGGFGGVLPTGMNALFESILKTEMYLTRAWKVDRYFHTNNILTESLLNAVFKMYFVAISKLSFTRNLLKCVGDFTKKSRLAATLLRKRRHSVADCAVLRFGV